MGQIARACLLEAEICDELDWRILGFGNINALRAQDAMYLHLVDSTNNGIELLITGISRGTTTFLLLSAIAV